MNHHGCRFDWCTNNIGRLEHFTNSVHVPCTGAEPQGLTLASISAGLWFNEDTDAAPHVYVEVEADGAGDVGLTLPQAIVLHDLLGDLISAGIAGTGLDPRRVRENYARQSAVVADAESDTVE